LLPLVRYGLAVSERHTSDTIYRLAVPVPLRRLFDYRAPGLSLPRGARVRVPFGSRELIGVVWQTTTEASVALDKLQSITEVVDFEPQISESVLQLAEFAASYYQYPLGEALTVTVPTAMRSGAQPKEATIAVWQITEEGAHVALDTLNRAPRQRQLLQRLQQQADGLIQAELQEEGFSTTLLRQFEKKRWAQKRALAPENAPVSYQSLASPVSLTPAQQAAVSQITQSQGFQCYVLAGVTGSGKTEVYMRLIDACLQKGQQALVLVPEIGLTPQTESRFRARFGEHVAVIHSGLSDKQRWQSWQAARTGEASVILGTRSALWASLKNPGLIVVDEEHDVSFKQQDGFRYHARDLAVRRAQIEYVPVVLGSATSSFETLRNVSLGRYQSLSLPERANDASMPAMRCLDIRNAVLDEGLSGTLIERISEHLQQDGQVLLFLNRRGFAPTLMCHSCGWLAECQRCEAHYTTHRQIRRLRCHHCGSERPIPVRCPHCKSDQLLSLGQGTERIEEALKRHFPQEKVARIDRDTTRGRDAMQRWSEAIKRGEYRLLVGTQMLAKGHDFPNVTLAALVDVDGAFFATDFRAPERMAQLITQVAGRAGRGSKAGEVVLQTRQPAHPLLNVLLGLGYDAYAKAELKERETHGLPPFQSITLMRAEAGKAEQAFALLQKAALHFRGSEIVAMGPVAAPAAKRQGRYRAQLWLEAAQRGPLQQALTSLLPELENWPEARRARWSVDIDPQEMV